MSEKFLGKISKAEFGIHPTRRFLMGLHLEFKFDTNSGVSDGGAFLVNVGESYKWQDIVNYNSIYLHVLEDLSDILNAANANYVSELVGRPIEIEIENQQFKNFRVITITEGC